MLRGGGVIEGGGIIFFHLLGGLLEVGLNRGRGLNRGNMVLKNCIACFEVTSFTSLRGGVGTMCVTRLQPLFILLILAPNIFPNHSLRLNKIIYH